MSTPTRRTAPTCCACAVNGHATADPAIPVMTSRRRIAFPKGQDHADCDCVQLQQGIATGEMGFRGHFAWQQSSGPNVRFGSKADIAEGLTDVRFTPESRHWNSVAECPLRAKRWGNRPAFLWIAEKLGCCASG